MFFNPIFRYIWLLLILKNVIMEVKGFLYKDLGVVNVSDKFTKRGFVLKIVGSKPEYSDLVSFELIQDGVGMLDGIDVGQEVTAYFNLKGREYKKPNGDVNFYNTLQVYKLFATPDEKTQQKHMKANNSFKPYDDELGF